MKRYKAVSVMLVIILVTGLLCGCGEKTSSNKEEKDNSSGEETIRIGLSMSSNDQYFSDLRKELEDAAKEAGNIEIVSTYAAGNYDVQKQLEAVATLKSLNVDFILGSLADSNNAEAVIETAGDVKQIWISRHPETSVLEQYDNVTFVGSIELEAGKLQGEWLANYFKDKKEDKTLNYVLFMGPLGLENSTMRTKGAKDALEEAGYTLNTVYEDTAEWDRAEAMNKMQELLSLDTSIDCVICNNDEMALGAIEALKSANALENVVVVGVDATTAGMTAVKSGEMAMTVLQNAKGQAKAAIENLLAISAGKNVDKETWVDFEAVTAENVDEYMAR